jgi:hypothetical protein
VNAAATVPSQKAERHTQAAGVVFCPAPNALALPTAKVHAPKRKAALRFILPKIRMTPSKAQPKAKAAQPALPRADPAVDKQNRPRKTLTARRSQARSALTSALGAKIGNGFGGPIQTTALRPPHLYAASIFPLKIWLLSWFFLRFSRLDRSLKISNVPDIPPRP